jgi:predicted DNA-binding transcriptional regulator AlpA
VLTKVQLLTLAQTAQRMGMSRGAAYRSVTGRGVTWVQWNNAWMTARLAERVFGEAA